jgi:hypothetical protein
MTKTKLTEKIRTHLDRLYSSHSDMIEGLFNGDNNEYEKYNFYSPKNRWDIIEKYDESEEKIRRLTKSELVNLLEKLRNK